MTSYAEIFNLALRKCDDPSLAQWPEEDLSNELYGWLQSTIAKLPQIRSETAERDSFNPLNADTIGFANDLSDMTKEVLALGMAREWLAPQIASTTLTWQRYSKKEGYSQKEHLSGLMELDEKYRLEIRKLLRDNTYIDSEYFD
jgi:hypothetical protein